MYCWNRVRDGVFVNLDVLLDAVSCCVFLNFAMLLLFTSNVLLKERNMRWVVDSRLGCELTWGVDVVFDFERTLNT